MMMVAVAEFVVTCQEKSKEKDKKPVYGKKVEETKKKKQLLADLQVLTVPRWPCSLTAIVVVVKKVKDLYNC